MILSLIEFLIIPEFSMKNYSEPTHRGDPVGGFLPIQKDRVNFLDVTNEGLKTGVDPNQKFNRFWARIEEKVYHHVNI